MADPLLVRVAGHSELLEAAPGSKKVRDRVRALGREHPSHWVSVHATRGGEPVGRAIHLLEPGAIVDADPAPDYDPPALLPGQEGML